MYKCVCNICRTCLLPRLILCVSGVLVGGWSVSHNSHSVCALNGSPVNMSCTYTYPRGVTVQDVWVKWVTFISGQSHLISQDGTQTTCWNQTRMCSLNIQTSNYSDAKEYYCIIGQKGPPNSISNPGVKLYVTGIVFCNEHRE